MKKIILFFIVGMSILGCSSSDDSNNSSDNEALILGRWAFESSSDWQGGFPTYQDYQCSIGSIKEYFIDGVVKESWRQCDGDIMINNLKYSFIDANKIQVVEEGGGLDPGTDYTLKYKILTLSEEKLILQLYYVDEGAYSYGDYGEEFEEGLIDIWIRAD